MWSTNFGSYRWNACFSDLLDVEILRKKLAQLRRVRGPRRGPGKPQNVENLQRSHLHLWLCCLDGNPYLSSCHVQDEKTLADYELDKYGVCPAAARCKMCESIGICCAVVFFLNGRWLNRWLLVMVWVQSHCFIQGVYFEKAQVDSNGSLAFPNWVTTSHTSLLAILWCFHVMLFWQKTKLRLAVWP